jgi:hypothetical protein
MFATRWFLQWWDYAFRTPFGDQLWRSIGDKGGGAIKPSLLIHEVHGSIFYGDPKEFGLKFVLKCFRIWFFRRVRVLLYGK